MKDRLYRGIRVDKFDANMNSDELRNKFIYGYFFRDENNQPMIMCEPNDIQSVKEITVGQKVSGDIYENDYILVNDNNLKEIYKGNVYYSEKYQAFGIYIREWVSREWIDEDEEDNEEYRFRPIDTTNPDIDIQVIGLWF